VPQKTLPPSPHPSQAFRQALSPSTRTRQSVSPPSSRNPCPPIAISNLGRLRVWYSSRTVAMALALAFSTRWFVKHSVSSMGASTAPLPQRPPLAQERLVRVGGRPTRGLIPCHLRQRDRGLTNFFKRVYGLPLKSHVRLQIHALPLHRRQELLLVVTPALDPHEGTLHSLRGAPSAVRIDRRRTSIREFLSFGPSAAPDRRGPNSLGLLAIAEYLAEINPRVWPSEPDARAWARCVTAEMHSGFHNIRDVCTMNCGLRVEVTHWSGALLREWKRVDELWCAGLSRYGGPFLAGATFSAANAFFAPVAFRVQSFSPKLTSDVSAYAARILELAHMREWYTSALAEHWRDEAHEEEARAAGSWLQDLRASAN
jgi:glutathione S-transferase